MRKKKQSRSTPSPRGMGLGTPRSGYGGATQGSRNYSSTRGTTVTAWTPPPSTLATGMQQSSVRSTICKTIQGTCTCAGGGQGAHCGGSVPHSRSLPLRYSRLACCFARPLLSRHGLLLLLCWPTNSIDGGTTHTMRGLVALAHLVIIGNSGAMGLLQVVCIYGSARGAGMQWHGRLYAGAVMAEGCCECCSGTR